jgi:UDP:flavonoid glycosyltransferase YjiC (YdhE family)
MKKQVPAELVRKKVFDILKDPSYLENAQRLSQRMRSFGGAQAAALVV